MDQKLELIKAIVDTLQFEVETLGVNAVDQADDLNLPEKVAAYEAKLIRTALAITRGHQGKAAKILRLKPSTLNGKLKLHGIEVPRD